MGLVKYEPLNECEYEEYAGDLTREMAVAHNEYYSGLLGKIRWLIKRNVSFCVLLSWHRQKQRKKHGR